MLLLMAESAKAADCPPVCCVYSVCLYAEYAHCLAANCMLAKTLLCVIMRGNKTHRSEFAHNDKNRHLNAHMVFVGERLWECLCKTQHSVHTICVCLQGCVQRVSLCVCVCVV